MKNLISVTIATYNRANLLEKVLNSLSKQTLANNYFEIIVCDSHSQDNTSDIVRFFQESTTISIKHVHTKNVLAAKRNLGISVAQNAIIIFLDDDCIPESTFLEKYISIFNNSEQDLRKTIYCGEVRFPTDWVKKSNYYLYRDKEGFTKEDISTKKYLDFRTIVVMNMAFLKESFLKTVGEVNENFLGYGMEDQELGWRLEKYGYTILMCDALIYHYELSNTIQGYKKKFFHTARDGASNLLKENMEAMSALHTLKFVDENYPYKSKLEKAIFKSIRHLIFHEKLSLLIENFLIKTDKWRFMYMHYLYKYVLACGYINGVKSRNSYKKNTDEWYS